MNRDELVTLLSEFLQRATGGDGDSSKILDPAGLSLAAELSRIADDRDVEAWYLNATLHLLRYQVLPENQDQPDLAAALAGYARWSWDDTTLAEYAQILTTIDTAATNRDPAGMRQAYQDLVRLGGHVRYGGRAGRPTPDERFPSLGCVGVSCRTPYTVIAARRLRAQEPP